MRRVRMILTGIFLVGVLMGGIGVGITLIEWSSLKYGGEQTLGSEYLVTDNLDFHMKEDESKVKIAAYFNGFRGGAAVIEEDPGVPEGVIRCQVTYNRLLLQPRLGFDEFERPSGDPELDSDGGTGLAAAAPSETAPASADGETGDGDGAEETAAVVADGTEESEAEDAAAEPVYDGVLHLLWYDYDSQTRLWLENKDRILEGLKRGTISNYVVADVTEVKIKVNPATAPRVEMENPW